MSGRLPGFGSLACSRIRAAGHANCFWPRRTLCDHEKIGKIKREKRSGEDRNVKGRSVEYLGTRPEASRVGCPSMCVRLLVYCGAFLLVQVSLVALC